jgi:hypothetical protein
VIVRLMLLLALSAPAVATEPGPAEPAAPVAPVAPEAPADAAPSDELRAALDELRAEIVALRGELRAEIAALRAEDASPPDADVAGGAAEPAALPPPSGRIARSLGDALEIGQGEVVDRAETMGGPLHVRGTVRGDARSVGGEIHVHDGGRIGGNAAAVGGDIIIEPGGRIAGTANVVGGQVLVRPGGKLGHLATAPPITAALSAPALPDRGLWDGVWSTLGGLYQRLVFLLAFAGAGVLVIALMPERIGRISEKVAAQPLASGLVGLLGAIAVPVLAIALLPTLVGPIVLLSALGIAWMMGFVALCQLIGDRLDPSRGSRGRWAAFLIGSVIVSFIGALPWIGVIAVIGASLVGIGAVLTSRYGAPARAV